MTAPQFGTPKPSGDKVDAYALVNRPLLIKVTEIVRGMTTSSGVTDAVRCDIVALDNGDEHPDALLFGKMLVGSFDAGVTYLGRLSKEPGKKDGRDHPWLFTDTQGDPADLGLATGYLAHKAANGPTPSPTAAPAFVPPSAAPAGAAAPPWATTPAAPGF